MKEIEYLGTLENILSPIPVSEREELLKDFREHFIEGKRAGKTEESIAKDLGDPDKIARLILAEYRLDNAEKRTGKANVGATIINVVGLSFFNLVVSLPFFSVLYSLVFSLYVVAIAFVLSPVVIFFFPWFDTLPHWISLLQVKLASLGLCFIGVAILLVSKRIWAGAFKLTVKFLRWNLSVIKGP